MLRLRAARFGHRPSDCLTDCICRIFECALSALCKATFPPPLPDG
jgi:hypothetical protein